MAKGEAVELRVLAVGGMDEAGVRGALGDKSNLVVAKAAKVIAERGWAGCVEALAAAYFRWETNDKGCLAKTAVARAIYELGGREEAVFLHGVRWVQREGTWGGSSDVAGELRGWCATGLARIGSRRAVEEGLRLLVDGDVVARTMGVRAMAYGATEEARAVLRLKALAGDAEVAVMGECLSGLLRGWPGKNEAFVGEFIDRGGEIAEAACGALGEARSAGAFEALKIAYETSIEPGRRRMVIGALGKMRREEAIGFLAGVIEDGGSAEASAAVEAMGGYTGEAGVRARVRRAVEERENASVTAKWREVFGDA